MKNTKTSQETSDSNSQVYTAIFWFGFDVVVRKIKKEEIKPKLSIEAKDNDMFEFELLNKYDEEKIVIYKI